MIRNNKQDPLIHPYHRDDRDDRDDEEEKRIGGEIIGMIGVSGICLCVLFGVVVFCSAVLDSVHQQREAEQIDAFIDSCDNYNSVQKILLKRKHRNGEDSAIFKSSTLNINDFACTDLQKEQSHD